ncbi:hypothetical protein [Miniphocaeibacter halophilus]|uniref:Uncharacterized protein n=1 Tax=Miniphocaeibacter halophilus TaxID=2931922 RepID=A0AC61MSI2_9FIRM|nr:hypothetical protein [Miniphocaeibacter halophilus]QQK07411.1 hypothetical protein JFY71_08825 [Miniphocaeibacter halophilus]
MEYKIKFSENFDVIKINDEKPQYLLNSILETEVNRLKVILDKFVK